MIKKLSQNFLVAVLTLFYANTAFGQATHYGIGFNDVAPAVEPTTPLTLSWWLDEGLTYTIIIVAVLVLLVVFALYRFFKKKKQATTPAPESTEPVEPAPTTTETAPAEPVEPAPTATEEVKAEESAEPEAEAEEGEAEEDVVK